MRWLAYLDHSLGGPFGDPNPQAPRRYPPALRGGTGSLGAAAPSDAICTQDDSSTGPLQRLLGGTPFLVNISISSPCVNLRNLTLTWQGSFALMPNSLSNSFLMAASSTLFVPTRPSPVDSLAVSSAGPTARACEGAGSLVAHGACAVQPR
jgi:hypothetical protein